MLSSFLFFFQRSNIILILKFWLCACVCICMCVHVWINVCECMDMVVRGQSFHIRLGSLASEFQGFAFSTSPEHKCWDFKWITFTWPSFLFPSLSPFLLDSLCSLCGSGTHNVDQEAEIQTDSASRILGLKMCTPPIWASIFNLGFESWVQGLTLVLAL